MLDGSYACDQDRQRRHLDGVYRGLDIPLDRPVALKVMDSRYAGDQQFLTPLPAGGPAPWPRLKDPAARRVYDQGPGRSAPVPGDGDSL